ncbi:MAG: ion transporter [Spirochaetales bacterium]|nr:ion transporter [Spirochaetales bacterium]
MAKRISLQSIRKRLYIVIFEADTKAGKGFDIVLLFCILFSVAAVLLNSVEEIRKCYGWLLVGIEWLFTIVFTIEYMLRIYCSRNALRYMKSFFGIIDLCAILPNLVIVFITGAPALTFIRVFRLLRIFVIFKLGRYIGESNFLLHALKRSFRKIVVFIGTVLSIVVIMGSAMYLIEGPDHGFLNIPKSMYWAIVTLTTVGYGDIAPQTVLGQTIASIIMLMGYGIIAVPTGILSASFVLESSRRKNRCSECGKTGLEDDSRFCRFCGSELKKEQ